MNCLYYQAQIQKERVWFVVGILRSFEHLAFDRTLDKQQSLFEFFVPHDLNDYFLNLMHHFQDEGLVKNLQALPNRLQDF